MAIDEQDGAAAEPTGTHGERLPDGSKVGLPGTGLVKGLAVTLKTMLKPAITQQYPHVQPDLPARTRGVIALKQENCTVCYKCSRACPDWCIYIDAHKETHEPASGGKGRSVKVLDRFAIDFALCMYCGICVEVCPFDALFWSPEFEYAEYDILKLTHEMDRLEEWTYKVLPPPPLEEGAVVPPPPPAPAAVPVAAAAAPPPQAVGAVAEASPAGQETSAAAPAKPPRAPRVEVEPDQETFDRVLAAELEKGTDRRVAEGRAKSAAMRAARAKAGGILMSGQEIAFLIVAIAGGIAAIRMVTSQNVIHAALYLVVTLTSVGAAYLLLAAEFLAWVQILIYVGAIVVLLLFSLMLTRAPIGRDTLDNQQRGIAAVIGIGILIGLVILLQSAFGGKKIAPNPTHTEQIGALLFRGYVLPFEIVSVLLLAALVGAVVLARKEEAE